MKGAAAAASLGDARAQAIKWNEANLEANEEERLAANRMRITEPKTPFHYLGDDGEPEAWPPKAAPATAAPREPEAAAQKMLQPGLDLSALASAAIERREDNKEDAPEGVVCPSTIVTQHCPHLWRRLHREKGQVRRA